MRTTRRAFGKRVLSAAASVGAASVGPGLVASLAGCGESLSNDQLEDALGPDQLSGTASVPVAPGERRVAIVGSGYGGAVAALRLTEAGVPVTLFEMGRIWNRPGEDGNVFCSVSAPDERAMWFKTEVEAVIKKVFGLLPFELAVPSAAGVLEMRGPQSMRVAMGRGLGGGSLVNLAIYVKAPREVLRRALPAVDPDEMYDVYYPRAMAKLRAEQLAPDLFQIEPHRYSRVGKEAADLIGASGELTTSGYSNAYLRAEVEGRVPASASVGEGGFGNNYGKLSLDKTYFAEALATGLLTIHSLTEIRGISRGPGREYRLSAKQIDALGNVLAERELAFSHVFVAAGSFGSSELLVRARDRGDLPDLNQAVGTQWGPNSDIFVARSNKSLFRNTGSQNNTVPGYQWRGRDQKGAPFFSMVIPLPIGIETYTSTNICVTESPEAGHFTYDSGTQEVSLQWQLGQQDDAISRVKYFFDRINVKANSEYLPEWYDSDRDVGYRTTYHPCGGVPLSQATDDYGRLLGYDRLYVVDSSLLPVAIGGNPALTTAALAERNLERIVAEDFDGPSATSCVATGCGPLRDTTAKAPYDYFAVSGHEQRLYLVYDRDGEAQLKERLDRQVFPALSQHARTITWFSVTDALSPVEARTGSGAQRPAGLLLVDGDTDPSATLDQLAGHTGSTWAYRVDAANAATYDRAWADGARSPGAQLVSMFRRGGGMTPEAFREHWYSQTTRQRVSLHPTWNYWRLAIIEALTSGAPDLDGITILHLQDTQALASDQGFYLDPLLGRVRSELLWAELVDGASLVSVPSFEWCMKSGFLMG